MNNRDNLRAFYALDAKGRDEGEIQDWKLAVRARFLHAIQKEDMKTLLEIGAGPGKDAAFFAEHGLSVVATDLTPEMVAICRERGLRAYELDFAHLSELNRTFDCIWSMNCLLHVEKAELPAVLEEIKRVLRPGGLFHFGVYGGEDKNEIKTGDNNPVPRFFSFFSDDSLRRALSAHFEIVSFDTVPLGKDYHFQSVVVRKQPI